jgi:outer membrane protein OmpA-like peptidoglycan-associated protein
MKRTVTILAAIGSLFAAREAHAQQQTFHLDRVEVAGSPDDGLVLFRPYTRQNTIFFGQFALGYSLNPLRTSDITGDRGTLNRSAAAVISGQFTTYANAGFEFLDRFIVGVSFPITWAESGQNPDYGTSTILGSTKTTTVDTGGPAVADTRIDLRAVIWRSEDRRAAFGGRVSIFTPTGNGSTTNFGGDGQTTAYVGFDGEYQVKFVTLVGQVGVHFRPDAAINDPTRNGDTITGLGVGNEFRWALGGFIPIKRNKYRVGATLFGQTGIQSDSITGNTFFTKQNTDMEWLGEGRMKFGPANHWWWGLAAGTRILSGYGGPDFRAMAMVGAWVPFFESNAGSPEGKMAMRERWRAESGDADHDGIPDDIDACPTEAEDHQGNDPSDGCPMPPDRDGDGIPDQYDKCPDQPEDKDGIDDTDGCPEDDADQDGIPDAQDACPREPGQPSPDPKKNGCPQFIKLEGSVVRVLQQVHFATGSSTILPDSFPMLQEIANLLKANPQIRRMSIEGHTDDRGGNEMNLKLSQGRTQSVLTWLVQHGVESNRLEAHGYGEERPIADNNTEEGRAANRRVEFKIVDEDTGPPKPEHKKPPAEEQPRDEGDVDQQ